MHPLTSLLTLAVPASLLAASWHGRDRRDRRDRRVRRVLTTAGLVWGMAAALWPLADPSARGHLRDLAALILSVLLCVAVVTWRPPSRAATPGPAVAPWDEPEGRP